MYSNELIKGTLQTIILKVLADHGKMYGYEIARRVKDLSEGTILVTEGALYPALHRLQDMGLLTSETIALGKRVRKYYTLTLVGEAHAAERILEFAAYIRTMNHVLNLRMV